MKYLAAVLIACSCALTYAGPANVKITSPQVPVACITPMYYSDPAVCTPPNATPTDSLPLPLIGGSYTDITFGGVVTLLAAQGSNHTYATPSPISATGKYAAVTQAGEQVNILDGVTGRVLFRSRPGNISNDPVRWDANDDDIYYWLEGAKIFRHRLSTALTETIADYSTDVRYRFASITAGGTGDTSKDNWLSFWAPNESNICAIDLTAKATYCSSYLAPAVISRVGVGAVDYTLMSKGVDSVSGKRYVTLMGWPAIAVFSVDTVNKNLRFEYRGAELPSDMQGARGNGDGICDVGEPCINNYHADSFEDADGQQYIVAALDMEQPCSRMMGTFRLNAGVKHALDVAAGGGRTNGYMIHGCGTFSYEVWVTTHVGCAKKAPFCALSTAGPTLSVKDPNATYRESTHLGEIAIMRGNLLEMRRLALHRSIHWNVDSGEFYWSTPRAALSPNGSTVIWDSNFGRTTGGTFIATSQTGMVSSATPTPLAPLPATTTPTTCTYSVSPQVVNVDFNRTNAIVRVTTTAGCGWSVGSQLPSWIVATHITSTSVTFTVMKNDDGPRSATVTVANQAVIFNQAPKR